MIMDYCESQLSKDKSKYYHCCQKKTHCKFNRLWFILNPLPSSDIPTSCSLYEAHCLIKTLKYIVVITKKF